MSRAETQRRREVFDGGGRARLLRGRVEDCFCLTRSSQRCEVFWTGLTGFTGLTPRQEREGERPREPPHVHVDVFNAKDAEEGLTQRDAKKQF